MLAAGPAAPSAGSAAAILAAAGSLAVSTWLSPTKGSTWCAPNDLLPLITRPVSGLTPKVYKQWEVYPKGVQSVFDRQNQVFTTCRHFLLTFSPIVDAYLKQAIENERRAEERNEQPELPPFPEIRPVVTIATTLIIRDYCTQIFRRWIEEELFQRCDPRTAWKLLKDLRASIIRKASRGLPRMKMLTRCARTTARATCTGMIAEVCVGEVILSFRWWRARKKRAVALQGSNVDDVAELPGHIINTESSSLWFARQTALCLTSVVLRGAGSAVLTGAFALATPEYSHLIGPMVSDFVVNTAMLAFVAPWADQ